MAYSTENALMIMNSAQCSLVIDPSMQAISWLKAHLKVLQQPM